MSHGQPERADVELLKSKLQASMLRYQARVEGVCPIKEKIIGESFD